MDDKESPHLVGDSFLDEPNCPPDIEDVVDQAEVRLRNIRVAPRGRWFKTAAEVQQVAANCRRGLDAMNAPFGWIYEVRTIWWDDPPNGVPTDLVLRPIEGTHFRGGRSMRAEYAQSICRILRATLGAVSSRPRARRLSSGGVRATLTQGPWGRDLLALPWQLPVRSVREVLKRSRADTLVVGGESTYLERLGAVFKRKSGPRVLTFSDLVDESFDWQLEQAMDELLGRWPS